MIRQHITETSQVFRQELLSQATATEGVLGYMVRSTHIVSWQKLHTIFTWKQIRCLLGFST